MNTAYETFLDLPRLWVAGTSPAMTVVGIAGPKPSTIPCCAASAFTVLSSGGEVSFTVAIKL
jgi:hypothetical protein